MTSVMARRKDETRVGLIEHFTRKVRTAVRSRRMGRTQIGRRKDRSFSERRQQK